MQELDGQRTRQVNVIVDRGNRIENRFMYEEYGGRDAPMPYIMRGQDNIYLTTDYPGCTGFQATSFCELEMHSIRLAQSTTRAELLPMLRAQLAPELGDLDVCLSSYPKSNC